MMEKMSIMERIEVFADAGETSAPLKLWKNQIARLEKGGFTVEKIAPTEREGEFYCDVDWKNPSGPEAQQMLRYTIRSLKEQL